MSNKTKAAQKAEPIPETTQTDPNAEATTETKDYSDGSSATGPGPLPDQSPDQQDAQNQQKAHDEEVANLVGVIASVGNYLLEVEPKGAPITGENLLDDVKATLEHVRATALAETPAEEAPSDPAPSSDRAEVPDDARNALRKARSGMTDIGELLDVGVPLHHDRILNAIQAVEDELGTAWRLIKRQPPLHTS